MLNILYACLIDYLVILVLRIYFVQIMHALKFKAYFRYIVLILSLERNRQNAQQTHVYIHVY